MYYRDTREGVCKRKIFWFIGFLLSGGGISIYHISTSLPMYFFHFATLASHA